MNWAKVFVVLFVSHVVGDYLLQTDWQAVHKRGGLALRAGDARRALFTHVGVYTLTFIPVLVVADLGWELAWIFPAIFVPHLIQDDGRLLHGYMKRIKHIDPTGNLPVSIAVDQTFHLVALLVLALVIGT